MSSKIYIVSSEKKVVLFIRIYHIFWIGTKALEIVKYVSIKYLKRNNDEGIKFLLECGNVS